MGVTAVLVLGLSLLLQLGAAAMSWRLARLMEWRAAWILVAAAISLMALRRGITVFRSVSGTPLDLTAESFGLCVSLLMMVGIAYLVPVIEAIRSAEREVRQLIESAPEAMVIADAEDKVVLANAQAGRLFGYFPHQMKGKDVEMLIPERFRGAHRGVRSKFHEDPRRLAFPVDAGLTGLHADGDEFPVQISLSPLEALDGLRVVASIRDMSEWQAAQEAVRESEGRYRSLLDDVLDTSSVGVCILDAEFRIVWVNRAYESYLGQERADVRGLPARQVVRDRLSAAVEDGAGFAEKLLATYDDNTYTEHFECHVEAGNGRLDRWLEFWSQPIDSGMYAGGRIEQFAEVTERRNAEQRLRQFVDIARHMRIGLMVYCLEDLADDRTLRIRIANPQAEKLLGVAEAEIAGRLIDEAFPYLRDQGVPQLFADVLRTGEAKDVRNFEYGDDRVSEGGWAFRAFPLPDQCVGVLFERLSASETP